MHHLYPLAKGDPLCPLGFHPQVRWPTRCKRCFRDYKEHGGKKRDEDTSLRRDDSTASSPSLSSWGGSKADDHRRSWASSTSLAPEQEKKNSVTDFGTPASWISTPDLANLEDETQANIPTVSFTLPKRRSLQIDTTNRSVSDSFAITTREKSSIFNMNDNLATRSRKLQSMKDSVQERPKRIHVKEVKSALDENTNHDVQFLIQVKSKSAQQKKMLRQEQGTEIDEDSVSIAATETTDTTLVEDRRDSELQEQVDSLTKELDTLKTKCDRLDREKGDILLRRIASMETTSSKTTATEVLKLQKRCNELLGQVEDLKDDKKSLTFKVKELEDDLEVRPTVQSAQKSADELRSKLLAAETLCEELMDENEDMKKELRNLEEEMEELQDNFREDQASEYSSLKKELEQTTKNCRILSFKLRKTERKTEQLEVEKGETEKRLREVVCIKSNDDKIKQLEKDLLIANETSLRLQKDLDETSGKLRDAQESKKQKTPTLGNIPKQSSTETKVSRETLTRGGSQDDPVKLQRDLQDSLEREADLKEQLKFAEEEAQNLRKKVSRIEDDNESLVLQLKKMATKAKSRRASPNRLTPEPPIDKDEGIADTEDPAELRLLLELNEQEATVLRKKVEELEKDKDTQKRKIKDLQDKLESKAAKHSILGSVKGATKPDQKLKVLEDETNALKHKLAEKEKETDRLQAELNLTQKRSKGLQKSKSLDLDQQTIDLKRQLQLIEQEVLVLRTKIQTLEVENDKLISENKKLQLIRGTKSIKIHKSTEKYIDRIAELEVELEYAGKKIKEFEQKPEKADKNKLPKDAEILQQELSKVQIERDKLLDTLEKLKQSAKYMKDRAPKKPSEFTSKVQLKNMVNDLEKEIGEIVMMLNNHYESSTKLDGEIRNTSAKDLENILTEVEGLKKVKQTLEKDLLEEQLKIAECKNTIAKHIEEKKELQNKVNAIKEQHQKLAAERENIHDEMAKLKIATQEQVLVYKEQTEDLITQLAQKEKSCGTLLNDINEKEETITELNTKCKKLGEIEKKLEESETRTKRLEKQSRDQLKQMSNKLEEQHNKYQIKDKEQSDLSSKWAAECKGLNVQVDELNAKIQSLENTISSKTTMIQQLEQSVKREREAIASMTIDANNKALAQLKEELNKNKLILSDTEISLESVVKSKKGIEEKYKKLENDYKKDKLSLEKRARDLDIDLQNERKKINVLTISQDKENKSRETEIETLKAKLKEIELHSGIIGTKKLNDIKKEYKLSIEKLEAVNATGKQQYDNLTAKYEILEEEHVAIKAKLVIENETLANQVASAKNQLQNAQQELNKLKEPNNNYLRDKAQLEEKVKRLERNLQKGSDNLNYDRERLKTTLEEKLLHLDQVKKEYDVVNDQLEYTRRENDDLKRKLEDYEKVSKIQRNISADSSAMENEIRQLRTKLANTEKLRKSDVTECKMRYDNQITVINDEIRSLQGQVTRFKRERDTYKHMLESAQKTIGELKTSPVTRRDSHISLTSFDEGEESKTKIATLDQQISCMEDELSETRLEASKLKTELVSERSTWEIKISELQSRINELEEERILSSGRTKIAGLRTRMELAWQKEREEQQRLLQETSTLARDLRQTLFEVERERDKERLESKRKQEQLKKTVEEDQEENRRKLNELQCDLLELRDAHAKLRTTNEKLRREKERNEKEREEFRSIITGRRRAEHEDDRRINALLEQVETLLKLTPEFNESAERASEKGSVYTPTPPRRIRGPKSRESSPTFTKENSVSRDERKPQVQSVMNRLNDISEELRRYQRRTEEDRDRERIKRTMGLRRATSTENDNIPASTNDKKSLLRNGSTSSSLHRRSLSLEHNIQEEQSIWKNDDRISSLQSLDEATDLDVRWSKRDASLDSRLSGGSTQSETGVTERRKKKGFIGKLKKLTKSRSIDDQDPGNFSPTASLSPKLQQNSNSEVNEDTKGSKKDLRDRITGIFKRGGSSSRSNSLERRLEKIDTSSTQRPLMPNGSNSSISSNFSTPEKNVVSSKTNKPK